VDFNQRLTDKLSRYHSADNNLPFHPHMTVARVNGIKNELNLKNYVLDLGRKIGELNWNFPIKEIVIYGVDSTKQPQHQEKLIHIPAR
jgi:2'-5' RNA ligase